MFLFLFLNPAAEPVIPTGITTKKSKAEMETHPVTVEITISKWSFIIQNSTNLFMFVTH